MTNKLLIERLYERGWLSKKQYERLLQNERISSTNQ